MIRQVVSAVVAVAVLGGMTACGGGEEVHVARPTTNGVADLTAAEALERAEGAMARLDDATFDLSGTVHFLGAPSEVSGEAVRLSSDECRVELSAPGKGTTVDVKAGTKVFHQFDDEAARLAFDPAVAHVMDEKWHSYPDQETNLPDCGLQEVLPAPRFWKQFRKGPLEAVGTGEGLRLDGRNDEGAYTVWVATIGEPLIVQTRWTAKALTLTSTLVETDSGASVSIPDPADVMEWR